MEKDSKAEGTGGIPTAVPACQAFPEYENEGWLINNSNPSPFASVCWSLPLASRNNYCYLSVPPSEGRAVFLGCACL